MKTALGLRPVIEKFVFASQVALGKPLLARDDRLYVELKELFSLRNRLVHATPREVKAGEMLGEAAWAECNPAVAHRFVKASADAAKLILLALDPPAPAASIEQIIESVERLRPLAEHAASVPPPTPEEVVAEMEEARRLHPQFFLSDQPGS